MIFVVSTRAASTIWCMLSITTCLYLYCWVLSCWISSRITILEKPPSNPYSWNQRLLSKWMQVVILWILPCHAMLLVQKIFILKHFLVLVSLMLKSCRIIIQMERINCQGEVGLKQQGLIFKDTLIKMARWQFQ